MVQETRQGCISSVRRSSPLRLAVLLAFGMVLPWIVSDYRVFQFTLALCYATALLGLNLLVGYSGQISLGHGAFYAIGAYVAALMITRLNAPYWLTLPVAGVICYLLGLLFGKPALRLEGHYLALATFALAVATPQLLKSRWLEPWTGGNQGILFDRPSPPAWLVGLTGDRLDPDRWLYYIALAVLVLGMILGRNLLSGRIGRALIAIREHQLSASTMGIDVARYKTLAFGISALYTGVAGALSTIVVQMAAPDSFTMFLSLSFIVGIAIGGLATISGAIYGGLFIQFVPNLADQISKAAPWTIYGILLILIMYLQPEGIAGAISRVREWIARRGAANTEDAACAVSRRDGAGNCGST